MTCRGCGARPCVNNTGDCQPLAEWERALAESRQPTAYDNAATLEAAAQILQVLEDQIDDRLGGMDDQYRIDAKRAILAFVASHVEAEHAYEQRVSS